MNEQPLCDFGFKIDDRVTISYQKGNDSATAIGRIAAYLEGKDEFYYGVIVQEEVAEYLGKGKAESQIASLLSVEIPRGWSFIILDIDELEPVKLDLVIT